MILALILIFNRKLLPIPKNHDNPFQRKKNCLVVSRLKSDPRSLTKWNSPKIFRNFPLPPFPPNLQNNSWSLLLKLPPLSQNNNLPPSTKITFANFVCRFFATRMYLHCELISFFLSLQNRNLDNEIL